MFLYFNNFNDFILNFSKFQFLFENYQFRLKMKDSKMGNQIKFQLEMNILDVPNMKMENFGIFYYFLHVLNLRIPIEYFCHYIIIFISKTYVISTD